MSKYIDRAKELRAIVTPHYNCGQAAILPFAEELGIPTTHTTTDRNLTY